MKIEAWLTLGGLAVAGAGAPAGAHAVEAARVPAEAAVAEDVAVAADVAGAEAGAGTIGAGLPRMVQEDPGAAAYRAAREALRRADFRRAYETFAGIVERDYAAYVADALYWQAFAGYRLGTDEYMRSALRALELQAERYPDAATRGDAEALAVRIRGELARLGDPEAAERIAEQVNRVAEQAARSVERSAEMAERVAERQARAAERAYAGGAGAGQESDCPEEEDEIRTAALNALLHMDADRAMPILTKVLARRDECSAPLRRRALFLVAQQDSPETSDILLDVARNDPDAEVREQAVFWLSQVEGERALEILQEILATSDDPGLQEKAVFAISQHEGERVGEILRGYALDTGKPAGIREKAIFWLGQRDDGRTPAFLRELYGSLESAELKEKVFFAISQTDDPESLDWMLERAMDESQPTELRKKALFWAGQGGAPLGRLEGLYERMADREMKEQLIFLYSQRDEPEALARLIEIARAEEDPELRKKAVFWLGQSDDPRAADFLLELIDR